MQIDIKILKTESEKQLVFGEFYPAGVPDSDSDFMTLSDLEDTAHQFMLDGALTSVDVQHDGNLIKACVVESWMQTEPSILYRNPSWVICVQVADPVIWAAVKNNELNGFSMEASGYTSEVEVEVEVPEFITGQTLKEQEHIHEYVAFFGDDGKFIGGQTDLVNKHYHVMKRGTITEDSAGHVHKYGSVYNFIEL